MSMTTKIKKQTLNTLIVGMPVESKQILSDRLKITKTQMLRIIKDEENISIKRARIIAQFLKEYYGNDFELEFFKV